RRRRLAVARGARRDLQPGATGGAVAVSAATSRWRWLPHLLPMLAPILVAGIVLYFLREPLAYWRPGETLYDEQAIQEWVREARVGSSSLPEMLKDFVEKSAKASDDLKTATEGQSASIRFEHGQKREEIKQFLAALCIPPTKIYAGQLPLFPIIY